MMAFGAYMPTRAEEAKNLLDHHLSAIEHRIRRIKETVPDAETPVSRLDRIQEDAREVVGDLHEIVERRTDPEAG